MVRTACVELSGILTSVVAGIEVASTAGGDVDVATAVIVGAGGSDVVGGIAAVRRSTVTATVDLLSFGPGEEQAPALTIIIIVSALMKVRDLRRSSRCDSRRSNTPERLYRRPGRTVARRSHRSDCRTGQE